MRRQAPAATFLSGVAPFAQDSHVINQLRHDGYPGDDDAGRIAAIRERRPPDLESAGARIARRSPNVREEFIVGRQSPAPLL